MCCITCSYPHKMKRLLLLFLLLVCSHSALSAYNGRLMFRAHTLYVTPFQYFTTYTQACDVSLDAFIAQSSAGTYTNRVNQTSPAACTILRNNQNNAMQIAVFLDCLGTLNSYSGSTSSPNLTCSGTPNCPSGQTVINGVCSANCQQFTGQRSDFSVNCSNGNLPATVCMSNNCAASVVDSMLAQNKTSSCWFGIGTGKYTGQSCTGQQSTAGLSNPTNANPPPADKPETDCVKQGKTFGTVNGVVVCVPIGSASGAPTKTGTQTTTQTTEKDANGNTTGTDRTEITSELSQDGDAVVTKETKKDEDGKTITIETESTKEDFCQKNPTHAICKPQEDDVCEENPDLPQCMKVGEPDAGGLIETQARNVTYTPVQITSGGSCPPDKTVSVAGRAMTFSYSWLCQYASMFKPFMLAFAYLSAAMFLFSGLRGANT